MRRLATALAAISVVVAACTPSGEVASTTSTEPPTTTTTTASPTTSSTTTTTSATPVGYVPVFEEDRCRFDEPPGRDITCGFVVVPEDRTDPRGNQVRLAVAIVAAETAGAVDPIIYLDGGPGGESLGPLLFSFPSFAPFAENRDLIFFDQRGIGLSEPSLDCPEDLDLAYATLDAELANDELLELQREAIVDCRNRLAAQGIDLSQYTSATNAHDVADIRIALGYDEVNLLGISYGTRLAQTVMRDHPEGIRSVVLDSVYTPDVDLASSTPANLDRALDELFAGCAEDPQCNELYPDLEDRLFALIADLEEEPIFVDATDLLTGDRHEVLVDGSGLLGTVFQGLYSEAIIPLLPQMIVEVEAGNTTTLTGLTSINVTNLPFLSFGMLLSVQCAEEVPFEDPATVAAADDPYPEFVDLFEVSSNVGPAIFDLCAIWDVTASGDVENRPVVSDIPTLVLAGEYDPITPPAWGELAATSLTNSTFVLGRGLGHGASLGSDCTAQLVVTFIDDPASVLDTSCVAGLAAPAWAGTDAAVETIVLVPAEVELFGSVVLTEHPEGWEEISTGAWARAATGLDQTALLVQGLPASGDEATIVDLFSSGLGGGDPVQLDDFGEWSHWESTFDEFIADIATQTFGSTLVIVVMIAEANERDQLVEDVFLPVLEVTRPGG